MLVQPDVALGKTQLLERSRHTPRRSRLERQLDILKNIAQNSPIRRTHIMYKTNMAWGELNKDLHLLKLLGLIKENPSPEGLFYVISETGLTVLSHYQQVEEALNLSRTS
jgi:predicted transcriptional regulator